MLSLLLAASIQPPVAPAPRMVDPFARWEKSIATIEKRLQGNPPAPGAVFFAGSSSIVLWDLKKWFPGKDYVNVGFGGSVIRDSTHFAPRILIPYRTGTIVFYAGDNDIAQDRSAGEVLADFRAFVAAARADNPSCRVLYIPVKPSLARWKRFDTQSKANSLIRAFCAKGDHLDFVDIVSRMLTPEGLPNPVAFVKYGLHLGV